MAPTNLIKFCGFIAHSKPNSMTHSAFLGKIPGMEKIFYKFFFVTVASPNVALTQRARVRSPVGTSFLGEVFSGVFLTCKTNVGKL